MQSVSAYADTIQSEGSRPRKEEDTWAEVFGGPFRSPHMFAMPVATVVGAYHLSLRGDASLLTAPDALSVFGVAAIGISDIAQIEYRRTDAIVSGEDLKFEVPSVGVQIQLPYRSRWVPDSALALRVGLPKTIGRSTGISQRAKNTDLYFVASQSFSEFTVHGAIRMSFASIELPGGNFSRTLALPAAGVEWQIRRDAKLGLEFGMIPNFTPESQTESAAIGSGILLRAGARWRIFKWLSIDSSFGYRIEVARPGDEAIGGFTALTDWDIRMGMEINLPWGAIGCKGLSIFCE